MQEPASTVFSILNGLSHIAMLRYFRAHTSSDSPLYYVWHLYAVVCCSCIFLRCSIYIGICDAILISHFGSVVEFEVY